MVFGSLAVHLKTQHGEANGGRQHWGTTHPGGDPRTYNIDFPTAGGPKNCPVKGCWGQLATRTEIWVHFLHRNVQDIVIILEEGNLPHPQCPWCDIMVPWRALNRRHIVPAQCAKGADRKRRRMVE